MWRQLNRGPGCIRAISAALTNGRRCCWLRRNLLKRAASIRGWSSKVADPSWPRAQERARELGPARCEWSDYAPEERLRESLLQAQCCVVTQRPEVRGLLWPSKLGFVLTLPRPILFIGPTDGAIAQELRAFPHARIFAPGRVEEVAAWIERLRCEPIEVPRAATFDARAHRELSLRTWLEWMNALR